MFQVPRPRLPFFDTHSRPSLPTPSLMHMPTCFGPCTNRAFAMLQVCALARFCLLCRSLSARHLFHLLCLYSLRSRSRSALAVFLQQSSCKGDSSCAAPLSSPPLSSCPLSGPQHGSTKMMSCCGTRIMSDSHPRTHANIRTMTLAHNAPHNALDRAPDNAPWQRKTRLTLRVYSALDTKRCTS